MGAGQSQAKIINPNKPSQQQQQYKSQQMNQQQKQQLTKFIKQAFRNVSINGMLTKDKFNQALAVLQGIGLKRLRDTPIADRLFFLFDKSKTGYISQTQFSNGISQILSDKTNAITYTFKAYDVDMDNKISKKQFTQFIQQTWMTGFRILAQNLNQKQLNGINRRDIQMWAKSKVSKLNEQSNKIFSLIDKQGKGYIQFPGFKQFVLNSSFNDITAHIDTNIVVVPLHLVGLYVSKS